MTQDNVKEMLDGVDEEQLSMIVSALEETARRYNQQGMIIVAQKMRLTADKVLNIKRAREMEQATRILGRFNNLGNEKTARGERTA
ncbi:hypothetical protein [Brevibacillus sp. H7]|uniref:hypothetical protein n=1 Tax=Brevibacillus sp. H7 TaxID=3349138 RepID=UPI00382AA88A